MIAEKNLSEKEHNDRIKKKENKTLKNSSSKCHTTNNKSKRKWLKHCKLKK